MINCLVRSIVNLREYNDGGKHFFGEPSPICHHENSITNLKNVVLVLVNNEDIVPFGRIRFSAESLMNKYEKLC